MAAMIRTTLVALALVCAALAQQDTFEGSQRIVAVGDVHGGYDEFVAVLRDAGVIDAAGKWSGGPAHLVQTGDCLDRGAQSRKVLDLLIALEGQARRAKGRVWALLGNHEAMNLYGDLRYVSPGEYEAFRTPDSAKTRDRAFEATADPAKKEDAAYREKWNQEHPLGWAEHREAFGPEGRYGRFLRDRPAIVKINGTLFLHGGLSPKYAAMPYAEINKKIRAELRDFTKLQGGVATADDGPLWYRGLASGAEESTAGQIEDALKAQGATRMVIGHTPTEGAVMPRYGGRVILIDVGLSKAYNSSPACLLLEPDRKAYALHRGTRLELPVGASGVAAYLRQAAALDPPGTNLRKLAESLR